MACMQTLPAGAVVGRAFTKGPTPAPSQPAAQSLPLGAPSTRPWPPTPAQQHDHLLDALLVLAVRLLLGAVGAARHLPLDVRPDAAQLLQGVGWGGGWGGGARAVVRLARSKSRGSPALRCAAGWCSRRGTHLCTHACMQQGRDKPMQAACRPGRSAACQPTNLRQLRHAIQRQQGRQVGSCAFGLAVAILAIGAGRRLC